MVALPLAQDFVTLESMVDIIDQPIFLLDANGPCDFVFRRLNKCLETKTGMNSDAVSGFSPQQLLPPRLAETITENYEICRASGQSHSYEENISLPAGTHWWQTTLSPIKNAKGDVVSILGVSIDITDRKQLEFDATEKLSHMVKLNEDLQIFAAMTAQDIKGPFETVLGLLSIIKDGFLDLGDEKDAQLDLCISTTQNTIEKMGGILETASDLMLDTPCETETDLDHMCRDICAMVDPDRRFDITFPQKHASTDRAALQMILRNLLENATNYWQSKILISAQKCPDHDERILFSISDDGTGLSEYSRCDGAAVVPEPGTTGGNFGLQAARSLIEARGGRLVNQASPFRRGAMLEFSLPGALI